MKYDHIIRDLLESGKFSVDSKTGNIYCNLTPQLSNTGYWIYQPRINGRRYILSVHRVVAYSLWGDDILNYQVNHINGDKQNNSPSNLELVTSGENTRHAFRLGLMHPAKGEKHGHTTLTKDQVNEIRCLYSSSNCSQAELSKMFGVSQRTISNIVRHVTWK